MSDAPGPAITRDEIDAAVRAWRRSSAISHEGRMAEALNAARKEQSPS